MKTVSKIEKISTAKRIADLALPERQRDRALADLAVADTLIAAFMAASKLLHLR